MAGKGNGTDKFEDIPHERDGTRPDPEALPPRKKLPKELQATLDSEEKLWDALYEGKYVSSILFLLSLYSHRPLHHTFPDSRAQH
jgi:hypothetical protein